MSKLGVIVGAGVGYVLGARAGRGRYEQIEAQAKRLWSDPRVQEKKSQAQAVAQEKAGQAQQAAQHKASQAQDKVQEKVQERTSGGDVG